MNASMSGMVWLSQMTSSPYFCTAIMSLAYAFNGAIYAGHSLNSLTFAPKRCKGCIMDIYLCDFDTIVSPWSLLVFVSRPKENKKEGETILALKNKAFTVAQNCVTQLEI